MAFNISGILANPACQVEYYPLAGEVKTDGSDAFSILFVLFNYFFELFSSLPTSFVLAHIHVAVGFNFLFGKNPLPVILRYVKDLLALANQYSSCFIAIPAV